jgi:hypothetical protein
MRFYTLLGLLTELDNLSLEELSKVKEKVDALIQSKTWNELIRSKVHGHMSNPRATSVSGFIENIDIDKSNVPINQVNNQNDMQALDSMIALVDEWLQDDSGYDESVYPNIEAALTQDLI